MKVIAARSGDFYGMCRPSGFPGRECVALISNGLVETDATLTMSEIAVAFRGHAFAALHGDGSARPMILERAASFRDSTERAAHPRILRACAELVGVASGVALVDAMAGAIAAVLCDGLGSFLTSGTTVARRESGRGR